MAEIVRDRIDAGALAAAAARHDCGAIAQFQGTTRDHHEGRRVLRLEYEAYDRMAQEVLDHIEREACTMFDVATCGIVVRLGVVPPGEASVVITVAAAHHVHDDARRGRRLAHASRSMRSSTSCAMRSYASYSSLSTRRPSW